MNEVWKEGKQVFCPGHSGAMSSDLLASGFRQARFIERAAQEVSYPQFTGPIGQVVTIRAQACTLSTPSTSRHWRSEIPPPFRYHSSLASTVSSAEAKNSS